MLIKFKLSVSQIYCAEICTYQIHGKVLVRCLTNLFQDVMTITQPFILIFIFHQISADYDCYDTKCWGSGMSRNFSIPCDNSYSYCTLNRVGLPLCWIDDSFHQWRGHGVHCYGHYNCGTDIRGAAICQDHDYTAVAVFIIIACVIMFLMVLMFCCYAKHLRRGAGSGGCCEREEEEVQITEYTELLVRSTDNPDNWRPAVSHRPYSQGPYSQGREPNRQVAYPYYTII